MTPKQKSDLRVEDKDYPTLLVLTHSLFNLPQPQKPPCCSLVCNRDYYISVEKKNVFLLGE